jgi:thiol-disulfide isomerase/thioredoxin
LAIILLIVGVDAARADDFSVQFVPTTPATAAPIVSFRDAQNRTVNLRDYHGRYVLLNLWATWCGPCVREMPSLDSLQGKFDPHKLTIIALSEDSDGLNVALAFYKRHDLKHLGVYADAGGQAPHLLRANGLPTTIFINPDGKEIGRVEGDADWDSADAAEFLRKVIRIVQ